MISRKKSNFKNLIVPRTVLKAGSPRTVLGNLSAGFTPTPKNFNVSSQGERGFTPTPISRNGCEVMNQHNSSNFSGNRYISEKIGVSLQSKRGFTLVELLVVISIVGVLSSTVLASLNDARIKARDAKRTQTVAEYKKAFYLYFHEYGSFPIISACVGDANGDGKCGTSDGTSQNSTFNLQLDDFISLPPIERAMYNAPSFSEGLIFMCNSPNACTFFWALEKDISCPGGSQIFPSLTFCKASLN